MSQLAASKQASWAIAAILFVAILPMPYGYYTLARLASTAFFGYFAYSFFGLNKASLACGCLLAAMVFQPFIKVGFGKEIWVVVDLIAGIFAVFIGRRMDQISRQNNEA